MVVHEEFTSRKLTLVFDSGKQVKLTREESKEFEKWHIDKQKDRNS